MTDLVITKIEKKDLVNLFETALYGNDYLYVDYDDNCEVDEGDEFLVEKMASIILRGGELKFTDMQSEDDKDDWKPYGKNFVKAEWEEFEVSPYFNDEQGKWGHIVYTINLQNILHGINLCLSSRQLWQELVDGDGDMWTAYNLMQYILFEEEIYG